MSKGLPLREVVGDCRESQPAHRADVAHVAHNDATSAALARLSLNQMTTVRWRLDEAVRHDRRAGIRGIGVSLQRLEEYGVRDGVELLRRSGLAVSSLGWIGGFTGAHGHSFDDALADARRAIRIAAQLRARSLIVVPGSQAGHIRSHALRLLRDALAELAGAAAEQGVRLAVQPMHPIFEREWSFLTRLDECLDMLTGLNHPCLGLAFGAYHLWQEPRLLDRLPEILPFVAAVQLSDWRDPPRCDNDRLLPGDGSIPLADFVEAFEAAGYDGLYEVEVWSRDLWKLDHATLMARCVQQFAELFAGRLAKPQPPAPRIASSTYH